MERNHWAIAIVMAAASFAWASSPQATSKPLIKSTSYEAAGERVLRHEVVVPAGVRDVWHAFTTADGLRTWAAPVVEFELKTGGKFHSSYQPDGSADAPGSIHNTVLSYVPFKMLAFKIGLTQAFPEVPRQAGTLFAVAELQPLGTNKTRVTLSMVGWGTGREWDQVYNFFDKNNPVAMTNLRDSFVSGAMDGRKGQVAAKRVK